MEDRAIALGGLVATPISIGIVAGAVLHHIGMSDAAGAAIAVPGAIITYILLMRYWRKQDGEK